MHRGPLKIWRAWWEGWLQWSWTLWSEWKIFAASRFILRRWHNNFGFSVCVFHSLLCRRLFFSVRLSNHHLISFAYTHSTYTESLHSFGSFFFFSLSPFFVISSYTILKWLHMFHISLFFSLSPTILGLPPLADLVSKINRILEESYRSQFLAHFSFTSLSNPVVGFHPKGGEFARVYVCGVCETTWICKFVNSAELSRTTKFFRLKLENFHLSLFYLPSCLISSNVLLQQHRNDVKLFLLLPPLWLPKISCGFNLRYVFNDV